MLATKSSLALYVIPINIPLFFACSTLTSKNLTRLKRVHYINGTKPRNRIERERKNHFLYINFFQPKIKINYTRSPCSNFASKYTCVCVCWVECLLIFCHTQHTIFRVIFSVFLGPFTYCWNISTTYTRYYVSAVPPSPNRRNRFAEKTRKKAKTINNII